MTDSELTNMLDPIENGVDDLLSAVNNTQEQESSGDNSVSVSQVYFHCPSCKISSPENDDKYCFRCGFNFNSYRNYLRKRGSGG